MQGRTPAPTYANVCGGRSGHVEAVQVSYDSSVVSYETLCGVWFSCLADPYDGRGQGSDRGEQYRPGVFWHTPAQRDAAAAFLAERDRRGGGGASALAARLLKPAARFHAAEACHQQYLARGALRALPALLRMRALSLLALLVRHAVFLSLTRSSSSCLLCAGGLDPDPETPYWMGCYLD
jgi:methionine-S-sulfoxide reductase